MNHTILNLSREYRKTQGQSRLLKDNGYLAAKNYRNRSQDISKNPCHNTAAFSALSG